ncbi:MAG TPA: ABC transporter permease [Gemmatimonadaceae bacterium]|nr:ABC transporter permease [Gemmatimonadaceae bacterium]
MTRPSWRRYLRFWGSNVGADVHDELEFHIDMLTRDYQAQGMSAGDAQTAALARFGDVARVDAALQSHDRRHDRAANRRLLVSTIGSDVRHAIRGLRRAPGFAVAAILCLALGTGATAAMFALVDALLLQPLAVEQPDNLVVIGTTSSGMRMPGDNSYLNYLDIRNARAALGDAAAWTTFGLSVRVGDRTDLGLIQAVSENYWSMLGVRPALGRVFTPREAIARTPLAVVSYRFWQRALSGASDVVGHAIVVDGIPLTIVGVAPRTFTGAESMAVPDAWVSAALLSALAPQPIDRLERRAGGGFKIIGRLSTGVSLATARSVLGVLAAQLQHQYPADDEGKRFVIERELRARPDLAVSDVLPWAAAIFMALTTLVLLVACVNVASLMLARASERGSELALRSALGARRARLVQLLLTESIVIAVSGGIIGIGLALGVAQWLSAIHVGSSLPAELHVTLDWRVLAITAGAVLLASVLSGAGPALRSSDPRLSHALKDGGRGSAGAVSRQQFRATLVVAQIAISFVLLIAAGLFLRSVQRARALDLGFRQDHMLMASADVSLARYDSVRGKGFYQALLTQVTRLPGVRGAALASTVPLGTTHYDVDVYADLPALAQERGHTHAEVVTVTPGYFEVMGIRLLVGRDFTVHDDSEARRVMVVNATTAARWWPGADPIGRRVRLDSAGPEVEVVGVAQTVTTGFLGEQPRAAVYMPFAQRYRPDMTLHLWTEGDPLAFAAPVRAAFASLAADVAPFGLETMTEHLDQGIAFTPFRLAATLATVIGMLGLVQALIGLYGVVAYSVAQRGREIGIRMAMGATSRDIMWRVIREGMVLTGAGLAIGLVLSFAATGVLRSLLIGVSARDPATFGALAGLLAAVTLIACWVPAAHAARVPPATSIRAGG